jgi:hypothetical protein
MSGTLWSGGVDPDLKGLVDKQFVGVLVKFVVSDCLKYFGGEVANGFRGFAQLPGRVACCGSAVAR